MPIEQNFWGFAQYSGNKIVKGEYCEWITRSKSGDEIEVIMRFLAGKGTLGFSRNGVYLGDIATDLEPGLYPAVAFNFYCTVSLTSEYISDLPASDSNLSG